jgi:hypothetical protein
MLHGSFIPSAGASEGILIGFNSALFNSIDWHVGSFSITMYLENKCDKVKWACVYGHVDPSLKNAF